MSVTRVIVWKKEEYTVIGPDEASVGVACSRIVDKFPPAGFPETDPRVVVTKRPAPPPPPDEKAQ